MSKTALNGPTSRRPQTLGTLATKVRMASRWAVDLLHPNHFTNLALTQQYLQALVDDDYAEAFAYVSETLQDCTLQHFIQITEFRRERDFSATLGRTTSISDITLVTVKITEPSFDIPFGRGENSFDTVFTLAEEEGQWRFSEPPWPMAFCPPERATPEPPKVEPSAQQAPGTYGEGWVS